MREILFRGKRTDNGEWVEGYLTLRPSPIQYGSNNSSWYIDVPPQDPDDSGGFYNIDPETIGEFTGLTDRNGKRIFEGDILKNIAGYVFSGECESEVVFINGKFFAVGFFDFEPSDFKFCEVVGNVFEKLFPRIIK
jgi:hypothetical protein